MLRPGFLTLPAILLTLIWPATGAAAPQPIDQIELLATDAPLSDVAPVASPTGEQAIVWDTGPNGNQELRWAGRQDGGPFGEALLLGTGSSIDKPSVSFTPDGGAYVIWGVSTGTAQQVFRPAGDVFSTQQAVTGCDRFVDSAASPAGKIAVVCSHRLATNPPNTARLGISDTLGPVSPNEDLLPPAYDAFVQPEIAYGPDGTLAIAVARKTTTTNPPPANETTWIRTVVRGPASFMAGDMAMTTEPGEVFTSRPAVLADGTVAVSVGGSAGARLMVRPPGTLTVFQQNLLLGLDMSPPTVDDAGNVHVLSADSQPPNRRYWANVRKPDGSFDVPVPIPRLGAGDPFIVIRGFHVAPDGTEYTLINADDGVYATSREPEAPAFATPLRLGDAPAGNPVGAITADGDLLVAWENDVSMTERRILVGGLDKTPPEVTVTSFPEQARVGEPVAFSASATDAMGVESTVWNFGGGQTADVGDATHAFSRPGSRQVSFTATDVAGHTTVETRTVNVTGAGQAGPSLQLKTPKRLKFRTFRKRGVRIVVRAKPRMRLRVVLGTSKRNARLRPLAKRKAGKLRNRHVLRIKPRKARLGKRRSFRLFVQVTGTSADGGRTIQSRKIGIRR